MHDPAGHFLRNGLRQRGLYSTPFYAFGCVRKAYFIATFVFVYQVMKYGRRIGLEKQRQELEALRALRETLLNTEEPHV